MTIKDSNITVMVKDMDISVSFYQSIGLALKQRWSNHYAQLTASGITVGLHPSNTVNPVNGSGNVSIGFTTDDFDNCKAALEKLHINITARNEEGGEFIHFEDPDGTALYFIKPKW